MSETARNELVSRYEQMLSHTSGGNMYGVVVGDIRREMSVFFWMAVPYVSPVPLIFDLPEGCTTLLSTCVLLLNKVR